MPRSSEKGNWKHWVVVREAGCGEDWVLRTMRVHVDESPHGVEDKQE